MSRFPALLDRQRRVLFDMVTTELGYPCLILSMGEESPHIVSDLDTLRVLDKAGYVAFTETPQKGTDGSEWVQAYAHPHKAGKRDYYDWFHLNAWYKSIVDRWYLLAPDSRSAIVGAVASAIVYFLLGLLLSVAKHALNSLLR